MKFTPIIAAIIGTTLAAPPPAVQTAHLTFRADPSTEAYKLTIVADGTTSIVDNNTPISLIDAPDYLARSLCKFDTVDKVEFSDTIAADNVTQQVVLKPASVIKSVSCEGMCVGTYGNCYDDQTGQPVGPCCNGLCAANRCRPWNIGQH